MTAAPSLAELDDFDDGGMAFWDPFDDGIAPSGIDQPAPAPAPIARPRPPKEYIEEDAPDSLVCPITLQLMDDPVFLVADGCTYSRAAIEAHFAACRKRK